MKARKIAIIGTGISGLVCGYNLNRSGFDVTLFEANDYIGGHTNTVGVEYEGETARIDTGFIVFNDRTYPAFMQLMNSLGVGYQETEMSFSVRNDQVGLEYNGHDLNSLFAQRSNIFSPVFWGFLREIARFNREVKRDAKSDEQLTIGRYLETGGYSSMFKECYLLPMISAIWSMGLDNCLDFPLGFFVRFFDNHGLLDISGRPQWYSIKGGSSSYIAPLTSGFRDRIMLSTEVRYVTRKQSGIILGTTEREYVFDEVVMACHADQALGLLRNSTEKERQILGRFDFSDNQVVLHTDTSRLPKRKKAWASWNYLVTDGADKRSVLTYNMNILQRLKKKNIYLVSLNQEIDERYVIGRYAYSHPMYSLATLEAQNEWQSISGKDRIHYCGAYWFNGFHEDGVRSGLRVCRMLEGA